MSKYGVGDVLKPINDSNTLKSNAIIAHIKQSNPPIYTVFTDFGNTMRMLDVEIMRAYTVVHNTDLDRWLSERDELVFEQVQLFGKLKAE